MIRRGTIKLVEGRFLVQAPAHVAIKLRRVFAQAQRHGQAGGGAFTISATPANAFELNWFRERHPLDFLDDTENKFHRLVSLERRRQKSIEELETEGYTPQVFKLALPPRDYQVVAADLAIRSGNLLVADDLGLGKTITAIAALSHKGMLPAVVVTMTHLPRQWEKEFSRFLPRVRVHRIRKGTPYDFKTIKFETTFNGMRRAVIPGIPDVVIINYAKLDKWADTLASFCKTVVYDEVQELRHSDSRKYEAATAISRSAEYRIGLSATPIYNYGAEMHAVMEAIAPGSLGTWREFYDEWCGSGSAVAPDDPRKVCVSDPAALGTYLRQQGLMIRRTRKDAGRELPALTVVRHVVEVDPTRINEATAEVAELAQRLLARTGTNFEMMKWSGEIDYRMRQATGIGKAGAVADFVRLLVEAGERVVVFGWHHQVYELLGDAFQKHGIPYAMYTGQQSDAEKQHSFKRFTAPEYVDEKVPGSSSGKTYKVHNDHAKVLIMSLRSGAGLDGLQHVCRTVVVAELDWSPKVMHQDIGRVHRDGQTEPVAAYYLVAEEGSDPVIADVLGIKDAQSEGIVNPDKEVDVTLVGAAEDHVKKLATDVLRRRGIAIPKPPPKAEGHVEKAVEDRPADPPPAAQITLDL